jgi:hypothetical protein
MRFIPTRIHGMLDYLMGALLIAAPWILDFNRGGAETWVPVILGAGVILYSLFTDYELGAVRKLSMSAHLWLDLLGGAFLAASPWLFGFDEYVYLPHLILGLAEMGAAIFTKKVPDTHPAHTHSDSNRTGTATTATKTGTNARTVTPASRPPMGSDADSRTHTDRQNKNEPGRREREGRE